MAFKPSPVYPPVTRDMMITTATGRQYVRDWSINPEWQMSTWRQIRPWAGGYHFYGPARHLDDDKAVKLDQPITVHI